LAAGEQMTVKSRFYSSQFSLLCPAGTVQDGPGICPGQVPIFVFELTVDEDELDSFRKLRRILIGGAIANGCRIEDRNVGEKAGFEQSAIDEVFALRWQRGHFANALFEW